MKTRHTTSALLMTAVLAVVLGIQPKAAEASFSITYSSGDFHYHNHKRYHKKHHKKYHHRHHKRHHRRYHRNYGSHHYHRNYGRNSRYHNHGHRRVYHLPRTAKFVWVDGRQYYRHRGVFYQSSPCGTYYVVVDDPHDYSYKVKKEVTHVYRDHIYESRQKEFVVHIRDNDGNLVTVRLKKEDKGYVGPQGEYYPEFPKVAQLRAMYAQ